MTQTQRSLTVDRAVELLASARRRRLLRQLLEAPEATVERGELAETLASGGSDPETLEVELAHTHLPKIADAGMIEYDHRSGAVRPRATLEAMKPLLDACEEIQAAG